MKVYRLSLIEMGGLTAPKPLNALVSKLASNYSRVRWNVRRSLYEPFRGEAVLQ
jgi:hypothetical protein